MMTDQNICDYLNELDVCKICILRYLNGRCNEYLDVDKSLEDVSFSKTFLLYAYKILINFVN